MQPSELLHDVGNHWPGPVPVFISPEGGGQIVVVHVCNSYADEVVGM